MDLTALPQLFESLPSALADRYNANEPWSLLERPLDDILSALPSQSIETPLPPGIHLIGDRIAIGSGCRIHPGATIEGPIWIGRNVEIRPGAFLRDGCFIGDGSLVGANVEVKHSILLPGAKAPHLNYVGDSILGRGVNLGAGTILSNLRHDGREISIPFEEDRFDTGRRKLGAVLGDNVLTGCNCVLHPGVLVGPGTQIYPGVQLRSGVYPGGILIKLRQEIEIAKRDSG